ncbi:MAG: hypothetical protein JW749_05240, partial [Sedimentisphaerales bacterium]|nr:hypothetical protein [Sedimentisphaerales bacterium]
AAKSSTVTQIYRLSVPASVKNHSFCRSLKYSIKKCFSSTPVFLKDNCYRFATGWCIFEYF